MGDEKNFYKTWKVSRKQIEEIKKDYRDSKEATSKISADDLKNFEEMAKVVFDDFESLTGKKCNRGTTLGNLSFYFDEGFEVDEIKLYIRHQLSSDWFKANPHFFTIAKLFPISDQDRINIVWDLLSHFQAKVMQTSKSGDDFKGNVKIQLHCGAQVSMSEYDDHLTECFKNRGACFI